MKRACLIFSALVCIALAFVAQYLLSPIPLEVMNPANEIQYNCGNVDYMQIWSQGGEAIQNLAQAGYTTNIGYQTGFERYMKRKARAFNPATKYTMYGVPDQIPRWFLSFFPTKLKTSLGWLEENSAYVSFYCKPPKMRYSGFAIYNLIRWTSRPVTMLGAELARPINQFNMNSTADGLVVMISTADINTYEAVRKSFLDAGVPKEAFNFYAISADRVRFYDPALGFFKSRPDLINFGLRRSGAEDPAELQRYYDSVFPMWYVVPPTSQEANPVMETPILRPYADKIPRPGGFGVMDYKMHKDELHLTPLFETFNERVIEYVEKTFGMKYKGKDVTEVIEHRATECIFNDSYGLASEEAYEFAGRLASCARITDDCSLTHTIPTRAKHRNGFFYAPNKLFVVVASKHEHLNLAYSSIMITQLAPSKKVHEVYENPKNLVHWTLEEMSDAYKIIGDEFEDFRIVFTSLNCPPELGNLCKTPILHYPDGSPVIVERMYNQMDINYGPNFKSIIKPNMLQFEG